MSIIQEIKKKIAVLQEELKIIQDTCSHPAPAVTKVARSSDGDYYNKSEYWYNCECKLCEKKWEEEQ